MTRRALILLLLVSAGCARPPAERLTVFAAASLTDVMGAVGRAWEEAGGGPVRFSFAASSTLARQVEAGARADVVALADPEWVQVLDDAGAIEPGTRIRPVGNHLVVIGPAAAPAVRDFRAALALPDRERLALGDPAHVPVGRYGRQALERAGLWDALEARLAVADNARAVLALVERGAVPRGIAYATDARVSDRVRVVATIPDSLHEPIVYEFAAVRGHTRPEVQAFMAFLAADRALRLFREAGFVIRAS